MSEQLYLGLFISLIGWDLTKSGILGGRIAVHPSGRFVLCSNRGHDSVAVFQVEFEASDC